MIVQLLVLGALGYVAYRTRPPAESFQKYFESSSGTRSRFLGRLVERLLGGRSGPSFHFTDLFLAWLVRVHETQQLFVGVFGFWIPVSVSISEEEGQQQQTAAPPILMGALRGGQGNRASEQERQREREEEAALDAHRSEANALKSTGRYVEAAAAFEKCAQLSLRSSDVYSSAELFEEGAKCYKMVKNHGEYIRAGLKAADLFIKKGRFVRAAGLYEKLGKHALSVAGASVDEGALGYLRRAAELYAMEDDRRGEGVLLDLAHANAETGRFPAAGAEFERQALAIYQRDPILVNQSQRLLLFSLLCTLEIDQNAFARRATEILSRHGWFSASREGRWVALLAQQLCTTHAASGFAGGDEEAGLCVLDRDLGMMASMPPWLDRLWRRRRAALSDGPLDLT